MVALRHQLADRLKGRRVIYWIDNESARFALIKGTSGVDSMNILSSVFHAADLERPSISWFERVPSQSNPADGPSRGKALACAESFRGIYKGPLNLASDVLTAVMKSRANGEAQATSPLVDNSISSFLAVP